MTTEKKWEIAAIGGFAVIVLLLWLADKGVNPVASVFPSLQPPVIPGSTYTPGAFDLGTGPTGYAPQVNVEPGTYSSFAGNPVGGVTPSCSGCSSDTLYFGTLDSQAAYLQPILAQMQGQAYD